MQKKEHSPYPEELQDAISEGIAGNCRSVTILFQGQQIKSLEVIREHKDIPSFSNLLHDAPFQDFQVKQHGGKITYIQQKVKILVNTPAASRTSLEPETTLKKGRQSVTEHEF
jgi:hypothetical protein